MKFRMVSGCYCSKGELVQEGETFSSPFALHKSFPGKIELISAEEEPTKNVKKETPPEVEGDVSDEFEYDPDKTGLIVLASKKGYNVCETDAPEAPLNKKPLKRDQVIPFIRANTEN